MVVYDFDQTIAAHHVFFILAKEVTEKGYALQIDVLENMDAPELKSKAIDWFGGSVRLERLATHFSTLKENNVELVIISNGYTQVILKCLEAVNFLQYFHIKNVYGSDHQDRQGSKAELISKLKLENSLAKNEVIFLDDDGRNTSLASPICIARQVSNAGMEEGDFEWVESKAMMSSDSSSSSDDSDDKDAKRKQKKDKKRKRKEKKAKKERKREKKDKKAKKKRKRAQLADVPEECTEAEIEEARKMWGGRKKESIRDSLSAAVTNGFDRLRGLKSPTGALQVGNDPALAFERHEMDAMFPKETGRGAKAQSKRAKYVQNRKYAENVDGRGVGELTGIYSGDANPLFAKRQEAANSNAKVLELMQKMRKQRGLPDPT